MINFVLQDLCLLAHSVNSDIATPRGKSANIPRPKGYYLFLPSPSSALLVKPVVSADLLLPCDFSLSEKASKDATEVVAATLHQVYIFIYLTFGHINKYTYNNKIYSNSAQGDPFGFRKSIFQGALQ